MEKTLSNVLVALLAGLATASIVNCSSEASRSLGGDEAACGVGMGCAGAVGCEGGSTGGCGSCAAGCGFGAGTGAAGTSGGYGSASCGASASCTGSGGSAGTSSSTGAGAGGGTGQGGLLTAGDWDDNLNFAFFNEYRSGFLASDPSTPTYDTSDAITIRVQGDDGSPVPNAQVTVADGTTTLLTAPTSSDGRLLFFPGLDGATAQSTLTVTVAPPAGQSITPVTLPAPAGTTEWDVTLPGAADVLPNALDLAFLIDTTGSMGDELSYVQTEVNGIANHVASTFGNVSIRYGLVVYRDQGQGDAYTTRKFDFTTSLSTFVQNLGAQGADGGGDTPEAMQIGMEKLVSLSWRTGNVARLTFLVADAPPHQADGATYFSQVDLARRAGIKIYPVAASGVDDYAEYYMRTGAEATLGRYLFLTDDSGVGDTHQAPHIPCYEVEKLNLLIERMVASELTGTRVAADPADIIRTVGSPVGNVCTRSDGATFSF